MGAVVLESRAKPTVKQVPSFQVVDGQQRLTTFQLFLTAARHYALHIGHVSSAGNIKRYLINSDPNLMESPEVEVFKVWPTEANREMFIDIVSSDDRQSLKEKYLEHWYKKEQRDQVAEYKYVPKMLGAYGYFYDRIRHSVESDDLLTDLEEAPEFESVATEHNDAVPRELKLDAIWQSLLEEFKVVEIVLDEGDDAQVIFETLNERGKPLLAADLVRNNIFQRADAFGEKAEILFAQHWKPFEDEFWERQEKQGRYNKQRIEFFLANFIAGKLASDITLSKLFSEYKAFLRLKKGGPRYANVEAELKDLKLFGSIYRDMIERSSGSPLAQFSSKLRLWDVTTVNPLVLRLWANEALSKEEKSLALDALLTLIVRRAVCNLSPKNYKNFFLSVVANMDSVGWSIENLYGFLRKQTAESTRFPRNEEFERALCTKPLYQQIGPARCRALLAAIELRKRGKRQETNELSDELTVEHILPVTWQTHWRMKNGSIPTTEELQRAQFSFVEDDTNSGKIVRRNRLKHSLGNLTLVTQSFNSGVSNYGFEIKRKEFEEQSILMLTKDFVKSDKWDEESIEVRGRLLSKLALQVWFDLPATGG